VEQGADEDPDDHGRDEQGSGGGGEWAEWGFTREISSEAAFEGLDIFLTHCEISL
jgi:hypothetical protein